jgi:FkbM family methyltransferase
MTTSELLSESVEGARLRESASFAAQLAESGGRIVLFGAGRLGRKVLAALRRRQIEPLAFADSSARLAGTSADGVPVMPPRDAAERFRGALFVVTTFLPAGGGVQSRLRELASLGCSRTTSFLPLGWRFEGVLPHFGADLPSRLLRHAGELARVADLWSDALSGETFRRELSWRLRASFEGAAEPAPDQYFPADILLPNPQESFVDGGAFDGDTLRSAPWRLSKVLAIEPDPHSAARLRSLSGEGVRVCEAMLGGSRGTARFDGTGTMASSRSDSATLTLPVETLDDLAAGADPTFIKLDVEGDELEALRGGMRTLRDMQPVVAVCLYHRPEDLWAIPLFLREALPAHRMYLRAHAWDGFELVAYAVPPARCLHTQ